MPRRWIVLLVIVALVLGALAVGLWMSRGRAAGSGWSTCSKCSRRRTGWS